MVNKTKSLISLPLWGLLSPKWWRWYVWQMSVMVSAKKKKCISLRLNKTESVCVYVYDPGRLLNCIGRLRKTSLVKRHLRDNWRNKERETWGLSGTIHVHPSSYHQCLLMNSYGTEWRKGLPAIELAFYGHFATIFCYLFLDILLWFLRSQLTICVSQQITTLK